jgi:hypothetical protein
MNKINENPNGEYDGSFPWPQREFENIYNNAMDASFAALGRKIMLHLKPIRIQASGIVQNANPAFRYNPYLGRAPRPVPNNISTTKSPAVKHIARDVEYLAHIRHGPQEISDQNAIGRLEVDEVATTTLVDAIPHILEAESVTIDSLRYRLHKSPRPIGLQDRRYCITVWKRIPEREDSGNNA